MSAGFVFQNLRTIHSDTVILALWWYFQTPFQTTPCQFFGEIIRPTPGNPYFRHLGFRYHSCFVFPTFPDSS